MIKTELDALDISEWMRDHWHIYVSEAYREKHLLLWTNEQGNYCVRYGTKILYEGSQIIDAVAAWDNA